MPESPATSRCWRTSPSTTRPALPRWRRRQRARWRRKLVLWEPPWRLPLKVQYTHGEGRKSFPMFRFDGTGRGVAGAHLGATGFAGKAGRAQVRSYNTDCGTDGVRTHMSNIESLSTQALADTSSAQHTDTTAERRGGKRGVSTLCTRGSQA